MGECQGCSQHRNVCSFKLDQIGILNSLCTFQSLEQAKKAACSLKNVQGSKATPNLIQIHIIGTLNPTKSPSFHLPSAPSSSFALCTGSHDSIRPRLIDRNICYVWRLFASSCKLWNSKLKKKSETKGYRKMKCSKEKCKIIENPKRCSKISD